MQNAKGTTSFATKATRPRWATNYLQTGPNQLTPTIDYGMIQDSMWPYIYFFG